MFIIDTFLKLNKTPPSADNVFWKIVFSEIPFQSY